MTTGATLANGYRIWFDLQPVQTPHEPERGIPRHVVEVALGLQRLDAPVAAFGLNPWLPGGGNLPRSLATSPALRRTTARAFAASVADGPLLYHVPSPFEAVEPRQSLVPPFVRPPHAVVVTIHDLIPFLFPQRYQESPEARQFFAARAELLRQADLFVTVSEHSRSDLVELFGVDPDRCFVTGNGVSDWFGPPADGEDPAGLLRAAMPALQRPFVLGVAGAEWRKNNEALLAAYARLSPAMRRDHQLVIAARLSPAARSWFDDQLARLGLAEGREVVLPGVVDDAVLRALYQRTSLFVFPSRYEGFGLPVLEAARCGAVAIAADTSSLPEVLEAPEATFPPEDVDALADLMTRALTDEALRDQLLAAGGRAAAKHTWDRVAERTIAAYEQLPPASATPARRRPTVAVVGPFRGRSHRLRPPAEALVAVLAGRCDVDCFADGRGPVEPVALAERTVPIEAFDRPFDRHAYDAVVCVVGNDPELLLTREVVFGGATVVWLPDDGYEELYLGIVPHGATRAEAELLLVTELLRAFGTAWLAAVDADDGDAVAPTTYRRAGLRFVGDLARHAEAAVVHPAAAAAVPAELHAAGANELVRVLAADGGDGPAAVVEALEAVGALGPAGAGR